MRMTVDHIHLSNVFFSFLFEGIETKGLTFEKQMAELKAENKPYDVILKQAIVALIAEEVGFLWEFVSQAFVFFYVRCFVCA